MFNAKSAKPLSFALLILLAFASIIAYGTQPLWEGTLHSVARAASPEARLMTDFPGGLDFATHQKSKTGDTPRVLSLGPLPADRDLVLVLKDAAPTFDMRWSPTLMRYENNRFLYANELKLAQSGSDETRKRYGYSLGLPFGSTYKAKVFELAPNQDYYLLLPQNARWTGPPYEVSVRLRGDSFGHMFLFIGLALHLAIPIHVFVMRRLALRRRA
jgi:hypothetical protein